MTSCLKRNNQFCFLLLKLKRHHLWCHYYMSHKAASCGVIYHHKYYFRGIYKPNFIMTPLCSTMTHFAPLWLTLLHYNSFYSTMTHWNILLESSIFFYYILAHEKFAYVSRGFSIKGRPNLAQESSSIFIQNHHQYSSFDTKSPHSTVQYTDYLT